MGKSFSLQPFAIGLVLGVVLATAWFYGHTTKPTINDATHQGSSEATSSAVQNSQPTPVDISGALSVSNQSAGSSVLIESVTVPPPGVWVAVREIDGGTLGNILGAVRAKGPRSAFMVPLLRNTKPGTTYAVELYRDNGDELFNAGSDSTYVDFSSDNPVIAYFTTTN